MSANGKTTTADLVFQCMGTAHYRRNTFVGITAQKLGMTHRRVSRALNVLVKDGRVEQWIAARDFFVKRSELELMVCELTELVTPSNGRHAR